MPKNGENILFLVFRWKFLRTIYSTEHWCANQFESFSVVASVCRFFKINMEIYFLLTERKKKKKGKKRTKTSMFVFHSVLHIFIRFIFLYLAAIRCIPFHVGLWLWHAAVVNVIIITMRHICKTFSSTNITFTHIHTRKLIAPKNRNKIKK